MNKFIKKFEKAIKYDFEKYYAIAKIGSKISGNQFLEKYKKYSFFIEKSKPNIKELFNKKLIDDVFTVKEYAFNAKILGDIMMNKIDENKCDLRLNTIVNKVSTQKNETLDIHLLDSEIINSKHVFNCTYSGINNILKNSNLPLLNLKHEITEMSLIELPKELRNISITVMDGPFFSIMPYPSLKFNTLSHVRYTPHMNWVDKNNHHDGYDILNNYYKKSNYKYMLNDAQRFIPILKNSTYKKSIFEVKTVQVKNENDDGRPILFTKDYKLKNFSNILGGKIDNIYDILSTIGSTFN